MWNLQWKISKNLHTILSDWISSTRSQRDATSDTKYKHIKELLKPNPKIEKGVNVAACIDVHWSTYRKKEREWEKKWKKEGKLRLQAWGRRTWKTEPSCRDGAFRWRWDFCRFGMMNVPIWRILLSRVSGFEGSTFFSHSSLSLPDHHHSTLVIILKLLNGWI